MKQSSFWENNSHDIRHKRSPGAIPSLMFKFNK